MNKFVLCVVNLFLITILIYVSVKYKFNLIILIEMLVGMFSLLFIKVIKKVDYTSDVKMLPEAVMEIEEKTRY